MSSVVVVDVNYFPIPVSKYGFFRLSGAVCLPVEVV